MWDNGSTGTLKLWCFIKNGCKNNYLLISHPCPMSMCTMKICTRLREITLLLMRWSDVVWRWLLCRQLYTMCILRELATVISVQVTSVRQWDWSNTVQNTYGTVSLHGAIVKITENRVIVNVYLQELYYILLVMNLWGTTVKCMVYVDSLHLYGGPTSVTETVRLIVLLLYSYTICRFGDF